MTLLCTKCDSEVIDASRDEIAQMRARIARMMDLLRFGACVIGQGAEIMTPEQISAWEGCRSFVEAVFEECDRGVPAVSEIHETLATAHPRLSRGQVWCKKCGATRGVDSSQALRHGWPECCGETMTIDSPDERKAGA